MSKKIVIGIVVIAAIAVGVWVFTRNNYSPSDQSSSSGGSSLPYGSGQDTAQTAPPDQQTADHAATTTPAPSATGAAVKEITVTGQNYSFAPATIAVKKDDTVKIIFKSVDGFHDFKIDGLGTATKRVRTGEQDTITFTANKIGSFEYYCSVGSHRQMGMKGTLTITE